jgi:hypothetical protein
LLALPELPLPEEKALPAGGPRAGKRRRE